MDWLKLAQQHEDKMIDDLRGLLKIPSLLDEENKTDNAPFGPAIREALDYVLNIAREDGFIVRDLDGYAGIIEYGEGEEIIGVLGHLDIVPIGEGWTKDPLGGEIDQGYLFGRGSLDDKGPTISAYHALKLLKENNVKTNKKIYLIIGCDEETGMRCMDYYLEHAPIPTMGFAPDSDFPVIYGEKGILHVELSSDISTIITELVAGERPNIVLGQAEALVKAELKEDLFNFYLATNNLEGTASSDSDGVRYFIKGEYAHGSTPQNGVNAGFHLLNFIGHTYNDTYALNMAECLSSYHGKNLDIDCVGTHMTDLTMNLGMMRISAQKQVLTLDIRYPNDTTYEQIITKMNTKLKTLPFVVTVKTDSHMEPLFNDPNGQLIKTLENTYRKYTNDNFTPIKTSGGGTYARKFNNFAAFGPEFPNDPTPSFVGAPHEKDEAIKIDHLVRSCAIYADALSQLAK